MITAYTDGACKGNGIQLNAKGGWGYYIITEGFNIEGYGGEVNTTNNRMELTAMIECIEAIVLCTFENENVVLYTDSIYVKKGMATTDFLKDKKGWIYGWEKNGWKTASKKEVKNRELWQELKRCIDDLLNKTTNVKVMWVKGHAGNDGNERADALANQGVSAISKLN